jgi:hypothetical protein
MIIDRLRSDFGYIPQQHTVIDNVRGMAEDEDIDTVNEKTKNRPHVHSGLEEFDHYFEELTFVERLMLGDVEMGMTEEIEKMVDEVCASMPAIAPEVQEGVQEAVEEAIEVQDAIEIQEVVQAAVEVVEEVIEVMPESHEPIASTIMSRPKKNNKAMKRIDEIELSPVFTLVKTYCNGRAQIINGKFIVLAGSIGVNGEISENTEFVSASVAAKELSGIDLNGPYVWVNDNMELHNFLKQ